jgi:heme-degrading monooxygenase HmoA
VILRIWSAALDPARLEEYRRFEAERSLPMLHRQPGFLGVFFLRAAEDRAASITIWEDRGAVEASESSPSYRRTARELADSGLLLTGEPSVKILEVEGGDLRPEALVGILARTRRTGPSSSPTAGPRD